MKTTKLFATLIAVLMLSGFGVNAQSALKIGFTNTEFILINMPEAKEIEAKLKTEKAQLDKMMADKSESFQKKLDDYKKNVNTMSEVIRADVEKGLQNDQTSIQEFEQNASASLQKKQSQLIQPVLIKIQSAITEVAKEAGYTYVFNTDAGQNTTPILLVGPESDNITNLVFKKMNVPVPVPKAAPAAGTGASYGTPATLPKKQ